VSTGPFLVSPLSINATAQIQGQPPVISSGTPTGAPGQGRQDQSPMFDTKGERR
jgi:hypothetical protein